jgi:hypothetical protein
MTSLLEGAPIVTNIGEKPRGRKPPGMNLRNASMVSGILATIFAVGCDTPPSEPKSLSSWLDKR